MHTSSDSFVENWLNLLATFEYLKFDFLRIEKSFWSEIRNILLYFTSALF